MNGNNSWQSMGQFARFPRHDLSSVSQPPAGELFPVGQMMEGGGVPAPAMMPQQPMPQQPAPQQYGQGQPQGKKILGMPKDRFIALMGTIAQAMAPETAAGRMGTGLVSMADMMRGERMAQGERQATEAEARRKATAELAKERRKAEAKIATEKRGVAITKAKEKRGTTTTIAKEQRGTVTTIAKEQRATAAMVAKEKRAAARKIPSAWEATYKSMRGKIDPDTKRPYTIEKIRTVYEKTEIKPPTRAEQRLERKELRELRKTILGIQVNEKTGKSTPNIEYPEIKTSIESFNELSDKLYYHWTPGTPKQAVDWGRDVPAIPATLEEVDVSTPEKIKASNLPIEIKRKLLLKKFPKGPGAGYEWAD